MQYYRKSFTLMELVLVIVVVGILVAVAIPRFTRNNLQEAADAVVQHIRYTQQLAMNDDKFDPSDKKWFKKLWSISFSNANIGSGKGWKYSIYADVARDSSGNLNSSDEVARHPSNPNMYMSAGWAGISEADKKKINPRMNLTKKYNIQNIQIGTKSQDCSSAQGISFDRLGRPYKIVSTTGGGGSTHPGDRVLKTACTITLISEDKSISIEIQSETGYIKTAKVI